MQGSANIKKLAAAFATFWAGSFLLGLPAIPVPVPPAGPFPGIVTYVSGINDAATKISAFESAIKGSITDQFDPPFYRNFNN